MNELLRLQSLFQTLSDANRLKIIRFIGTQSRSVSEVVEATGLSQPLVSHHLKVLRERAILKTRREGPFIFYMLNDPKLLDALGLFAEITHDPNAYTKSKDRAFSCPEWFNKIFK